MGITSYPACRGGPLLSPACLHLAQACTSHVHAQPYITPALTEWNRHIWRTMPAIITTHPTRCMAGCSSKNLVGEGERTAKSTMMIPRVGPNPLPNQNFLHKGSNLSTSPHPMTLGAARGAFMNIRKRFLSGRETTRAI